MRADEVNGWLLDAGWTLDRVRGSHYTYDHPRYARSLCVVYHGHTMEPYRLKRVAHDLRHMGAWAQAEAFERRAGLRGARRQGDTGQGQEGQETA